MTRTEILKPDAMWIVDQTHRHGDAVRLSSARFDRERIVVFAELAA